VKYIIGTQKSSKNKGCQKHTGVSTSGGRDGGIKIFYSA